MMDMEMKMYYDIKYGEDDEVEDYDFFNGNITLFSENRHSFSPTSTTNYFKVEKCPEDNDFLQRIVEATPFSSGKRHKNKPSKLLHQIRKVKVKERMSNDDMVRILSEYHDFKCLWPILRDMSVAAKNFDFYYSCIRAAAHFVHLTCTKDSIDRVFPEDEIADQLNELWIETMAMVGKKNFPFDDICECVVGLTSDMEKYSALTEPDVDELVMTYHICLNSDLDIGSTFKYPFSGLPGPEQHPSDIVEDVKHALSKMDSFSSLTVDGYTRFLIMFAKKKNFEVALPLYTLLSNEVIDTEAMLKLDTADSILRDTRWATEQITELLENALLELIRKVQFKLRNRLLSVIHPLLKFDKSDTIIIHPDVYEIIEVAELRRRALGNRFISKNHFLWAFYECGYGLPPNIRDTVPLSFEDDSPPYHIYMTAIQLAAFFEEKQMELEHFVFAVIYSKDFAVDEVTEMQKRFRLFVEEVALDRMERPRVTPRPDIVPDNLEGVAFVGRKAIS